MTLTSLFRLAEQSPGQKAMVVPKRLARVFLAKEIGVAENDGMCGPHLSAFIRGLVSSPATPRPTRAFQTGILDEFRLGSATLLGKLSQLRICFGEYSDYVWATNRSSCTCQRA